MKKTSRALALHISTVRNLSTVAGRVTGGTSLEPRPRTYGCPIRPRVWGDPHVDE